MTSKLLNFESFIGESKTEFRTEAKRAVGTALFEQISAGTYFDAAEKEWMRTALAGTNYRKLDESLLTFIRKKIEEIKDSKIGKAIYDKVGQLLYHANDFCEYLGKLFDKMIDKALGYFMAKYQPIKKAILADYRKGSAQLKAIKANVAEDLKDLRETASFWLTKFKTIFTDAMKKIFSDEIMKECIENGDFLNEIMEFDPSAADSNVGVLAFLDRVTHKIEKIPPFSYLTKIKDIGEVGAEKLLTRFSEITHDFGGPGVFEFATVAAVTGYFIEYFVKHLLVDGTKEIIKAEVALRLIPVVNFVINAFEIVALIAVTIETFKELEETEHDLTIAYAKKDDGDAHK